MRVKDDDRPVEELISRTAAATGIGSGSSRREFLLRNGLLGATVLFGEDVLAESAPSVTYHTQSLSGLRERLRIVQLTDLHRSWCVSETYLDRVIFTANAQDPDMILLTGDFVTSSSDYMGSCIASLRKARSKHGSLAVLGNHDYGCDGHRGGPAITRALESAGIPVLTNRSVTVTGRLNVVGVDDFMYGRPDPDAAFRAVRYGEPTIVMTHNPMAFPQIGCYSGITLAGHTHGGQINVPIVTRFAMERKHHYLGGWFRARNGPGKMYVSRGVGVVGVPIRVRCDPEIAVFDLIPG